MSYFFDSNSEKTTKLKTYHLKTECSTHLRKLRKHSALCTIIIFITSIFAASTAQADSGSTIIFSSGFEDGFNSWTTTYGGVSIISSPVYSGNYSMKCPSNSQATVSIGTQSETYTAAEFYFDKTFTGYQSLIAYFNANDNPTVSMGISAQSGRVFAFVQTLLPSYSYRQYELIGITPGTWYKFALDTSATSATIYLDDQQSTTTSLANIPEIAQVSVGMFWGDGSYTGNIYIDNVQISTSPPLTIHTPILTWSKTFGGTDYERGYSVVQTSDSGYAIAGDTFSGTRDSDVYLVKTDSTGTMQWNKTYGGTKDDFGVSVVQTSDGGYAIAGRTSSFGAGNSDVYLVKTDSTGTMQWNKTYGGTDHDFGNSVVQTSDGGYAIAGQTFSFGAGGQDVYFVKTDSTGNMLWNKTYGGAKGDGGYSVVQTSEGGYAIAGDTSSFGAGNFSVYLVKTDPVGNMLWSKTYGGTNIDGGQSVVQTSDGGYAIAGGTRSFGAGGSDFYLVKTDSTGNMQWNKTYGGTGDENGQSVVQTSDGGYVIVGFTNPLGTGFFSPYVYFVKTDSAGNMQWNKTLGVGLIHYLYFGSSVVQTSDGGYAIAGYTEFGAGGYDFYFVKTDSYGNLL